MKCWYSPYRLEAVSTLGAHTTSRHRQGVLFKIEYPEIGIGYADCHPWIELGDRPVDEQIALLAQGKATWLTAQSLTFAQQDARARSRGASLFAGLNIPLSHYLVSDPDELNEKQLEQIAQEGFTRVKVKVGRHLRQEMESVFSSKPVLERLNLRLRLDFNCSLIAKELDEFVQKASQISQLLDWIEDPVPFDSHVWKTLRAKSGFRLAIDRDSGQHDKLKSAADVLVLKPAVQSIEAVLDRASENGLGLCITSYMDHPVGQAFAAYAAGRIQAGRSQMVEICGLLSHRVFRETRFSKELRSAGPRFLPPDGTGIGFDALLNSLDWKVLK
jgi:O-succinylbenzoate synthase